MVAAAAVAVGSEARSGSSVMELFLLLEVLVRTSRKGPKHRSSVGPSPTVVLPLLRWLGRVNILTTLSNSRKVGEQQRRSG